MPTTIQPPVTDSTQKRTLAERVCAAQEGCRKAFGELFEQFYPSVYAVTLKYSRNRHTAEEISQDVFIQAMEKIRQLRQPECFGAWLRAIARRMTINQQTRKRSCLSLVPELLSDDLSETTLPSEAVLEKERAEVIQQGLDQLGVMDRNTLVAFYLRHQSLATMSDEFEAPLGTIKRRLHVARRRLANEIDPLMAV
ncbi:MAG: sigma-70 family RNA polymerase sigma factor [Planctomycetota bacterium]|nr:sigma-70 family RNA polymerase sigma factor [Planctomycetota bacterium]